MIKKTKTKCTYCGSTRNIENDHVRAKTKGGVTTVPACKACNTSKGTKPLMEWVRYVKANNHYRFRRMCMRNKNKRNNIALKINKIKNE